MNTIKGSSHNYSSTNTLCLCLPVLLPLLCAKFVPRWEGFVIMLNSICIGKVQGVLTDQTASKTNYNHIVTDSQSPEQ